MIHIIDSGNYTSEETKEIVRLKCKLSDEQVLFYAKS